MPHVTVFGFSDTGSQTVSVVRLLWNNVVGNVFVIIVINENVGSLSKEPLHAFIFGLLGPVKNF